MARSSKRLALLPVERALKVLSGRWKAPILYHVLAKPKRLSELQRLLPAASQKMIIQRLRELEHHGLVHRVVFAEIPSRVTYSATSSGQSLAPVLAALCDWGRSHAPTAHEPDIDRACLAVSLAPATSPRMVDAG